MSPRDSQRPHSRYNLIQIASRSQLRKQPFSPPGALLPLHQDEDGRGMTSHHREQVSTPTLLARNEMRLENVASSSLNRASSSLNRVGMTSQNPICSSGDISFLSRTACTACNVCTNSRTDKRICSVASTWLDGLRSRVARQDVSGREA